MDTQTSQTQPTPGGPAKTNGHVTGGIKRRGKAKIAAKSGNKRRAKAPAKIAAPAPIAGLQPHAAPTLRRAARPLAATKPPTRSLVLAMQPAADSFVGFFYTSLFPRGPAMSEIDRAEWSNVLAKSMATACRT